LTVTPAPVQTPSLTSSRTPDATATAAAPTATTASLTARDFSSLQAAVASLIGGDGAAVSVTLVELGGAQPQTWSLSGSEVFNAASTYKLAALMLEAQNIAAGKFDPEGLITYQDSDYEEGWYDDYTEGATYTRSELAMRAGQKSDNTAGHMLVRDVGGADALNAWAASLGTTNSSFFIDNTTTSGDLADLWIAEAQGKLGGAAAQAWLYPLLTRTAYESGIPADLPASATVVHKTGALDLTENDAALVAGGPSGLYVLTTMTNGLDETAGPVLIAAISAAVWQYEAAR
jgi:beta-lactamase class A